MGSEHAEELVHHDPAAGESPTRQFVNLPWVRAERSFAMIPIMITAGLQAGQLLQILEVVKMILDILIQILRVLS